MNTPYAMSWLDCIRNSVCILKPNAFPIAYTM
jgi:hypothetical protein